MLVMAVFPLICCSWMLNDLRVDSKKNEEEDVITDDGKEARPLNDTVLHVLNGSADLVHPSPEQTNAKVRWTDGSATHVAGISRVGGFGSQWHRVSPLTVW